MPLDTLTVKTDSRYASIECTGRVWAISAIHGCAENLVYIHRALLDRLQPNDHIVYLGNYTGHGHAPLETMHELQAFQYLLNNDPALQTVGVTMLRGQQEEMITKLLQIQFSHSPEKILNWMVQNGIRPLLRACQSSYEDGLLAIRGGVMGLTRWTNFLHKQLDMYAEYQYLFSRIHRAAYTAKTSTPLLFVHCGYNTNKALDRQGDTLWWDDDSFKDIQTAPAPFNRVIRGFDPHHNGLQSAPWTISLDTGCGRGGALSCAALRADGNIDEILQA